MENKKNHIEKPSLELTDRIAPEGIDHSKPSKEEQEMKDFIRNIPAYLAFLMSD